MKLPVALALGLASLVASGVLAVGCGGDDDKPAYCEKRDELTASIQDLKNINITSLPTDLQDRVETISTNADEFADATKEAFPQESEELETQANDLSASVNDIANGESVNAQTAIRIVGQVSSTLSAAETLEDKVSEGCS